MRIPRHQTSLTYDEALHCTPEKTQQHTQQGTPELFLYTHTRNHDLKTFIDKKSEKLYERMKEIDAMQQRMKDMEN